MSGKKNKAAQAVAMGWLKEKGLVKCAECSLPNWDVYHTPDHPCPKAASGDAEVQHG